MMLRPTKQMIRNVLDNDLFYMTGMVEQISCAQEEMAQEAKKEAPGEVAFRRGVYCHQINRYLPDFDYRAPQYQDGTLCTAICGGRLDCIDFCTSCGGVAGRSGL